jgi:hypothetical protein
MIKPKPSVLLQQHDIGSVVGVNNSQGFSIRRPSELGDLFGRVVRELVSRRAIGGLRPNVVHAFFPTM